MWERARFYGRSGERGAGAAQAHAAASDADAAERSFCSAPGGGPAGQPDRIAIELARLRFRICIDGTNIGNGLNVIYLQIEFLLSMFTKLNAYWQETPCLYNFF